MALFDKWVRAEVQGRRVECLNTWFNGAAIFVDGVEVARNMGKLALDETQPFVEAQVDDLHIEMHILSILFTQIEVRVNGQYVAGDRLIKESGQ
ncbi:hypothetical protein [Gymnodinialimonas hymeniacidonis]|uniref:hypothetical protein n=1 Tax=Gymnodinialimonas hymeniacidonis TaxID=3126508 RepID=UPI0034C5EB6C